MTVEDLIKILQTHPKDLIVVTDQWSEYRLYEELDVHVECLCEEREDDWVPNARPDKPTKKYLVV